MLANQTRIDDALAKELRRLQVLTARVLVVVPVDRENNHLQLFAYIGGKLHLTQAENNVPRLETLEKARKIINGRMLTHFCLFDEGREIVYTFGDHVKAIQIV